MPLYEYECQTCESRFEIIVARADADARVCARCGSREVKRLLSVIAGSMNKAEAPAPECGGGACGNC